MRSIHTSASDWKAAADLLGEVAQLDSFAGLDDSVPPLLRALFRADLVIWERFGNDLRHVSFRLHPAPAMEITVLHPAFERHFPEHPGYARFGQGLAAGLVFLLSDFGSTRRFLQTGLWREAYIHLHARHQLGFSGRIDRDTILACSLNRLAADYGPRDRELAHFVRPRLIQQVRSIRRREQLAQGADVLQQFIGGETSAFACLAPDGRILELSRAGRALLARASRGAWADASRLPESCTELMAELRRERLSGGAGRRRFTFVRIGPGLSALLLLPEKLSQTALAIFQEDISAACADSRRRLSRRELEVLEWLGAGKTDAEIATLLGISIRTVGKHCENIFAKLGVENRTAAALFHRQPDRLLYDI